MDKFKIEGRSRLDGHESRIGRTEKTTESILETLSFMRVWMDKKCKEIDRRLEANDLRFEEQTNSFKAHVDMRFEESLSFFRILVEEQRNQAVSIQKLADEQKKMRDEQQRLGDEQRKQGAALHELTSAQRETNCRLDRIEHRLGLGA